MSFADILILVLVGAALLLALNYLRRRRQCSCGKGKSCRVATPGSSVPSAEQDPSALESPFVCPSASRPSSLSAEQDPSAQKSPFVCPSASRPSSLSAEQDPSALATERGKFGDGSKTALDDRKAKPLFEACAGCPLIDSCGKVNKMSDKRNNG